MEESNKTVEAEVPAEEKKAEPKHSLNLAQKEFDLCKKELEALATVEEKLGLTIQKMDEALAQGGQPLFKLFWDLKKLSLELFKESMSPPVRSKYWERYQELTKQARRLKEIFDEKSAFAAEQIEMAIQAAEESCNLSSDQIAQAEKAVLKETPKWFKQKLDFYRPIQAKLNLLNANAARINTLRKELIKTEMRIAVKNKFFSRLSSIGDQVFPPRKELIKEQSERFIYDVDLFISSYFNKDQLDKPLNFLRDEIKGMQAIAKELTLNTHAFTHARKKLSECWENVKEAGKELKKEQSEKREVFQANKQQILDELQAIETGIQDESISLGAADKQFEALQKKMRDVELGFHEVKELKSAIHEAKKPLHEKMKAEEEKKAQKEREKVEEVQKQFIELSDTATALQEKAPTISSQELENERALLQEAIAGIVSFSSRQKKELQRLLRPLEELLVQKKEDELLSLSDDDKESLENYREVLKQRRKRRKELKEHLDLLRKKASGSGLDIEQSLSQREQILEEEERLQLTDDAIEEIIEKIGELKRKV